MEKPVVLFVCTGNSARSQMAEGWLRHLGGHRYRVASAGTAPVGLNPLAVVAMQEVGIDVSGHTSDSTASLGDQVFDLVVTVCGHAQENCPVFPRAGKKAHWGFDDPAAVVGTREEKLSSFRTVRDQIGHKIRDWLGEV